MKINLPILEFIRDNGPSYGNQIARQLGMAVGTVYPQLAYLERDGFVEVQFRGDIRFYRLTQKGRELVG